MKFMNRCYIEKVYYVTDSTNEYEEKTGKKMDEPLLAVDILYSCKGVNEIFCISLKVHGRQRNNVVILRNRRVGE